MSRQKAVSLLLQLATTLYLAYIAISSLSTPSLWVKGGSVCLILLAIWVMSSKRIFIPSLVTTLLFAVGTVINIGSSDKFFQYVVLTAIALSLTIIHAPRHNERRRSA